MSVRALPLLCAALLAVCVAGCGGSSHKRSQTPATSTPATGSTSAATATAPNATAPPPGGTSPPAGGPVPRGFVPVSFTAISQRQFWLLGTAPCRNPVCTSVVRTTDGGAHFVGIPAPVAPLAGGGSTRGLADLRFANRLDGFAGDDGAPAALWETHDGGAHWQPGLRRVITFDVTAGRVYALTGGCRDGLCTDLRLAESPATADQWRRAALPVGAISGSPALTSRGSSVWLSVTPTAGSGRAQALLYSQDGGQTFTRLDSPCVPGLGGTLQSSSAQVLWAVCPTGTMAGAWRSSDGGAHWSHLATGPLANSARLGAASDRTAVLFAGGGTGRLLRTTDAGQSFANVGAPPTSAWMWLGFTDPSTGSALVSDNGPEGVWRSRDGGAHWHGPLPIA